jgi:hypothetical protein
MHKDHRSPTSTRSITAFEREGEVVQAAMVRVLEDTSVVAIDIAMGKMHATAARKAVEAVAMAAAMAAMCAMRNDPVMVSLEAVAMEAAKVAMHELRDGVIARQALVEAQMYGDDAADEESCVVVTAMVATGMTTWLLVNGDETKVEDDDKEEEAEAAAEAQRDAQLRATEVCIKAAAEAESVATAEAERVAEAEAEEQAAHWVTEMDKALAYRWDVDRSTTARREAARRADTEHHIEHCQEAAIRAAMAAIEAAGVGSNVDGGALQ